MYRAIPRWRANLTLGENYINSEIFSSWRYTGASLESDDRMLPPKLRGYAPQVSGIADTNARVVISQQGRILYDSTVPAGPFTIQDLDSSVRGRRMLKLSSRTGGKKRSGGHGICAVSDPSGPGSLQAGFRSFAYL